MQTLRFFWLFYYSFIYQEGILGLPHFTIKHATLRTSHECSHNGPHVTIHGGIKQPTFSLLSLPKARQQTQGQFTERCSHTNNLGPDSAHKPAVEGFCSNSSGTSTKSHQLPQCWASELRLPTAFPATTYAFDRALFSSHPFSFVTAALPPMPRPIFTQKF